MLNFCVFTFISYALFAIIKMFVKKGKTVNKEKNAASVYNQHVFGKTRVL